MATRGFGLNVNESRVNSQIQNTSRDLEEFLNLVRQKVDTEIENLAKEFRRAVVTQLHKSEIEVRTGELISSWKVEKRGMFEYQVFSTDEQVAHMMNAGTRPHTITGDNWLLFEPENPSEYIGRSERNFTELDDGTIEGDYAQDGLITSDLDPLATEMNSYVAKSVNHPGTPEYAYFEEALQYRSWGAQLDDRVERAIIEAANEAGL